MEWPWGDRETRGKAAARRLLSCGLACKVPAAAGETRAALYPAPEKACGSATRLCCSLRTEPARWKPSGESASEAAIPGQPGCCPFCSPTPHSGGQGRAGAVLLALVRLLPGSATNRAMPRPSQEQPEHYSPDCGVCTCVCVCVSRCCAY